MTRFLAPALLALALAALTRGAAAPPAKPGLPPLPVAVSSLGAAVADGYLYVYGGHSGKVHQYSTETTHGTFRRLKLDGGTKWEELPGGPKAQGLALVAHKGKLYRIGGMQPRNKPGEKDDSVSLSSVGCYDPAAKEWQAMPEMPEGRSSHDAVVVGDKIVVVGGWKMNGRGKAPTWHKTALVLDLAKKEPKWESVKQPFERRALTATAHKGKVHVLAGMTSEDRLVLSVDIYDPKTGKWSKGKDIPGGRGHGFTPASCVEDGQLCVSPADGKLYLLDGKGAAWQKAGDLREARTVHRLVPAGKGRVVAVGGSSGGKPVARVEVIDVACGCCKAVLEEQAAAWNAGDLDRFLATYWNSDELTFFSGGTVSKGHKAVAERYRKNYRSEGKEMGKLTFTGLEVERLGADSAMARARWQVVTSKEKMGGLFTLVLRKFPDGWKITHDHTSRDDPPKKK
jgi:N-acetylneuraminic acid mutarotase/ketosteroid isomerase-like protein